MLNVSTLHAGELPSREPLDVLWEQYMLEGKIDRSVAIQIKDGVFIKSELPAKEPIEYSRGAPESAGLGSPGISVMQLGEGFWENGGWVLKGGVLGLVTDGQSKMELHGKAIVHRQPYFPLPHRTIPHETGYDFFLISRGSGGPKGTIVRKWTFTPEQVELKPQRNGPPEADVRATLQYDAAGKVATVVIVGLKNRVEESVKFQTLELYGDEVSRERAIEAAKQELGRVGENPARFDFYFDEGNKGWDSQMALLKESSRKSDQAKFENYNSVLRNRPYWSLFIVGRTSDGRYPKDDGFTAIIDKQTGKLLFFIPGG